MTIEVILPNGALGASSNDNHLDTLMRIIAVAFGKEGDWASKYGADYENDIFLMKPFCWCEDDGNCPWCTGCDGEECDACKTPHSPSCYKDELHARLKAAGVDGYKMGSRDTQTEIKKKLCHERNIRFTEFLYYCDCGVDKVIEKERIENGCDYQTGRGIFQRFAPVSHNHETGYYDPPNFWYKPANFRVTWYKYIGRSMAANKDALSSDALDIIFKSHPHGMTPADAIEKLRIEQEESNKSFADMIASVNAEMEKDAHEPRTFENLAPHPK